MLVLAALADPVRREIVELLADGELGAGEIAARFPVTRPAVSRHLRVLREAGLVAGEVRAQRRVYRLERGPLAQLDAWLDRFRPLQAPAAPGAAPGAGPGAALGAALGAAGPAGRLDALDTEIRRGRRRSTPPDGDAHVDRTTGRAR